MKRHPYEWRLWLRTKLPWFLINLGFADKGNDCQNVNAQHKWYNINNESSGCYYCKIVVDGKKWS